MVLKVPGLSQGDGEDLDQPQGHYEAVEIAQPSLSDGDMEYAESRLNDAFPTIQKADLNHPNWR